MRLVDATAAAQSIPVKPSTIRQWARRGKLTAHGTDDRGRKLYDYDEIAALELVGRQSEFNPRRPRAQAA